MNGDELEALLAKALVSAISRMYSLVGHAAMFIFLRVLVLSNQIRNTIYQTSCYNVC